MKVPLINIMKYYLSCQDIYVDQKLLQKYFASVLSFPSVFALIQTLKQFGVVLSVVSSDWYTLIQCDEKVLLHIDQEKDTWVMLKECSTDEVVYMDEHANVFTESRNSFTGKWDGLLLYVESVDENIQSALKKKNKEKKIQKSIVLPLVLLLVFGFMYQSWFLGLPSGFIPLFILLKFVGGVASFFLLRHSLGLSSRFENKVCFISKLTDCNAVLHSSASKIFSRISLSDVGVVYFGGGMLLLLSSLQSVNICVVFAFLLIVSLCSIPYSIFSIAYQFFVLKKLCPFCLVVIAVLLSESVLSICILPKVIFDIDVLSLGLCLSAFILLAVVLSYLKEAYNRKIYFENLEFKYLRFKRNDNIYRYLLQQEKTLKKNEVESIDVGEESAPIVVTIILGLYCHLCAETFKRIRQLLVNSSSDFRFQFHFVSKDVDDEPFVCLYSVYKEKGMSAFVEALNEWYSIHDYAKLGQCCSLEEKEDRLVLYKQQHIEFEEMNRIYKTPTVYVDGKLLPDLYEIGDLVYFV